MKTLRIDYALSDSIWAKSGSIFLSGTQALVRLLVMQCDLDAAQLLNTQGFVSGYRGSPLGMVDQAIWKAGKRLNDVGIQFVPAINEELAATQILGTQRVGSDPNRTVDGVYAMWYGKGPGVDRAGDAIKHGNAFGSSPLGGVLIVAGDDHGCVSSSMPHQSDQAFQSWHMPIVSPANVEELLQFGLYGWALSRHSGAWVGMTALSEVVESSCSVDLDRVLEQASSWQKLEQAADVHYRWPDLPSLQIETRLGKKLKSALAFAKINSIDREVIVSAHASIGIVTCGKAHFDLMETFRRLGISAVALSQLGVRLYKVGLSFPLEPTRLHQFAAGLKEILVVEEKGAVVETQIKNLFYNWPSDHRPAVIGKFSDDGHPLISDMGELRPSRLISILAKWLTKHFAESAKLISQLDSVVEFTACYVAASDADTVKRLPYFCAGCPHNASTKVPEGSVAKAGIGCHFMANWMNRSTEGLVQMGGEGVDWVSHSKFTKTPHVFQNLGDGTYYHSGFLAIRQAIAAHTNITYKILYNDAVAMTGGQPIDGQISVVQMANQVASEGVASIVIVSDDIEKYSASRIKFPSGTQFYDRSKLDTVQRSLRETAGVSVLIYEQTCASEKRRRRKKGELSEPNKRLLINDAACEGCGDCTVKSNCVAVVPLETTMGRKRQIDQTACNKDFACQTGFCPSFVGVIGGRLRKKPGVQSSQRSSLRLALQALGSPVMRETDTPWDLLVTGVGGTGVVTVGAVVAMAAHLDHQFASVLDFMGFAQKGGAVLSFVRLAKHEGQLNQVRIDTQQADAILACDLVVAASQESVQTIRHARTRVAVNLHEIHVAESLSNPDADLKAPLLLEKLLLAAGSEQVMTFNAQALAQEFLGDTVCANILALGFAWQQGLVPVRLEAMSRAITLNNVAVENNLFAFDLGRLAAGAPQALKIRALNTESSTVSGGPVKVDSLDDIVKQNVNHLTGYQNEHWAQRYQRFVRKVERAERAFIGFDPLLPLSSVVAKSLAKLMSYKDEYEVARLYSDGRFQKQLADQFEGDFKLEFYLAPPVIGGNSGKKIAFGQWMMPAFKVLSWGKHLRGTLFDVFANTQERKMERGLIQSFETRIESLLPDLSTANYRIALEIAALPLSMRGYGHVKLGNVGQARLRESHLLNRFNPARYPKVDELVAGQFRGIAVVKW